jgi:hypothetical protein
MSTAMPDPSTKPTTADEAPVENRLTDYDRAHFTVYLRLLDAADEGVPWEDVARIVLRIDPASHYDRAKRTHDSHLARARWMTEQGYRDLLQASAH